VRIEGSVLRTEGIWSSRVHDRAILYSLDQGKAIILNATGAALWDALDAPRSPSDLAKVLIGRFPDLSAERAREDVDSFLDQLLSESVLQLLP
jgi:hypothetical protein